MYVGFLNYTALDKENDNHYPFVLKSSLLADFLNIMELQEAEFHISAAELNITAQD